jgi:hypothetical protein
VVGRPLPPPPGQGAGGDEDAQRRIADILRKAAELIRRRDVDLG